MMQQHTVIIALLLIFFSGKNIMVSCAETCTLVTRTRKEALEKEVVTKEEKDLSNKGKMQLQEEQFQIALNTVSLECITKLQNYHRLYQELLLISEKANMLFEILKEYYHQKDGQIQSKRCPVRKVSQDELYEKCMTTTTELSMGVQFQSKEDLDNVSLAFAFTFYNVFWLLVNLRICSLIHLPMTEANVINVCDFLFTWILYSGFRHFYLKYKNTLDEDIAKELSKMSIEFVMSLDGLMRKMPDKHINGIIKWDEIEGSLLYGQMYKTIFPQISMHIELEVFDLDETMNENEKFYPPINSKKAIIIERLKKYDSKEQLLTDRLMYNDCREQLLRDRLRKTDLYYHSYNIVISVLDMNIVRKIQDYWSRKLTGIPLPYKNFNDYFIQPTYDESEILWCMLMNKQQDYKNNLNIRKSKVKIIELIQYFMKMRSHNFDKWLSTERGNVIEIQRSEFENNFD